MGEKTKHDKNETRRILHSFEVIPTLLIRVCE